MENLFKQNLLELRSPKVPKTFGEALFGKVSWVSRKASQEVADRLETSKEVSEQTIVIEALERFTEENAQKGILAVDGGEIVLKKESDWVGLKLAQSVPELKSLLSIHPKMKDLIFDHKKKGRVKAIFVTEVLRTWEEAGPELKNGFVNELILGFPLKTAEFFERMIMAMKFDPEEVIVYPVEEGERDIAHEVINVALYFRPEVVITLGAKASQKILKGKDRLSVIHGQFFGREIEGMAFQIVPLFHPTIIETNQNMKKTAWTDMQKIMKFLKKLS